MRLIQAKTILSNIKDDYFGLSYNMNLYRGCQHACIYCDSRSACYQIDNFTNIQVKSNAIELLEKVLARKRKKGTIGFGSMNDPYMPIELEQQLSRKALKVIARHHFPVHIITKSDLVLRDLDLIKKISKTYSAITFSITTTSDRIAKKIEPNAPSPSARFEAIARLRNEGIYTGITMMPVLPFINDTEGNVMDLIKKAKKSGAQYILPYFGVTLREGSREYYYKQLDKLYPGLKNKYIQTYGNTYTCDSVNSKKLYSLFYKKCQSNGIATKMVFYTPERSNQLSLFQ